MRRTISGAAVAVLASATLLVGCAEDAEVVDPAVEDTMEDMEDMEEDMGDMEEDTEDS